MCIDFVTVASNNHASPSGALPFLLPSSSSPVANSESVTPIPSSRLQRWAQELRIPSKKSAISRGGVRNEAGNKGSNLSMRHSPDMRNEAYMSVLDHRIRNAYLHSLYLSPPNFEAVATPLYLDPCSSNGLVKFSLAQQLRAAAESELLKQSPVIDVDAIYQESRKAFEALSELLGDNRCFFAQDVPGLFDASVFAYTHILLAEFGWKDLRLRKQLVQFQNLVDHQQRLISDYFL